MSALFYTVVGYNIHVGPCVMLFSPPFQTQDELATLKFELKQKELALSQSRSHVEELMKKQDRQNTEAAMKKGSDEHRIRGLQEQL
jgi:hypothetical protein